MKKVVIAFLFFAPCILPLSHANDAPVKSVGKAIQPLAAAPVRMVSEKVDIFIRANTADVNCLFVLVNEGRPDTIEVGFPRGWEGDLIDFAAKDADKAGAYAVETLAQKASYNEINGLKLPWWKVFRVPFDAAGKTVRVENRDRSFLLPTGGSYPYPLNDLQFTYIMKTGAAWSGTIGDALMTVNLPDIPPDQIVSVKPGGYAREGHKLVWRFHDFEPTADIEITLMNDVLYDRTRTASRLLAKNPSDAYTHFLLGTVYFNRRYCADGIEKKAEDELLKAVSLDPTLWDARWYLAALYEHRAYGKDEAKMHGMAQSQIDEVAKGNPEYRCDDTVFVTDDRMWAKNVEEWKKMR